MTVFSAGYSTLEEAWGLTATSQTHPAAGRPPPSSSTSSRAATSRRARSGASTGDSHQIGGSLFDRDSSGEVRGTAAVQGPPPARRMEDFAVPGAGAGAAARQYPAAHIAPPAPQLAHAMLPEVMDLMLYMISGMLLIFMMEQISQVGIMIGQS
jgi:hypothetical protein